MVTAANICICFPYNDHQCQAVRKQQSEHLQKAVCLQLHAATTTICPIYTRSHFVLTATFQYVLFRTQSRKEIIWFVFVLWGNKDTSIPHRTIVLSFNFCHAIRWWIIWVDLRLAILQSALNQPAFAHLPFNYWWCWTEPTKLVNCNQITSVLHLSGHSSLRKGGQKRERVLCETLRKQRCIWCSCSSYL